MQQLDPQIAAVVDLIPFDVLTAELVASMRDMAMELPRTGEVESTDHTIAGTPDVVVRVHRPKGLSGPLPCIYAIHGGGYVIGSYAMQDSFFDEVCPKLGCVGVSVEYRLAPDTPYPGPLEDCYAGLAWVFANAAELGVDATRIGIAGVSAGGGLAAALALLARDRGEYSIAFQLLDSPMLDDRQQTASSQQDGLFVWSRGSNTFGWKSYLGALYGTDDIPPTAAPARATDLAGLPPAFIAVGAMDGFRDEDADYAFRLNDAGVPTELHVYPGACHGFLQIAPDAPVSQQCKRDTNEWLTRMMQR